MTDDEEKLLEEAEKCHLCDRPFTNAKLKTRDGCVVTGKYIEAVACALMLNH